MLWALARYFGKGCGSMSPESPVPLTCRAGMGDLIALSGLIVVLGRRHGGITIPRHGPGPALWVIPLIWTNWYPRKESDGEDPRQKSDGQTDGFEIVEKLVFG
jgi:hypothetical protein